MADLFVSFTWSSETQHGEGWRVFPDRPGPSSSEAVEALADVIAASKPGCQTCIMWWKQLAGDAHD